MFLVFLLVPSASVKTTCVPGVRSLPASRLHIAYATDRSLKNDGAQVVRACEHGVNVIVWSFAHLRKNKIDATFSVDDVVKVKAKLEESGFEASHLVSFGGWNGPHPETSKTGAEWFAIWDDWNKGVFDGVDWDLEGHDDAEKSNELTSDVVDLVLDFTKEARDKGYIVGIAPAESYLDPGSTAFDLKLNHQPRAPWPKFENDMTSFPYAGRNAYASLVAQGDFDFISVQLYEGFSSACYAITHGGTNPVDYLVDLASAFATGFDVTGMTIKVPPDRLVFGFANAWADGRKFVRIQSTDIAKAFARLGRDRQPRGTMFWVLDEEGHHPSSSEDHEPSFFARDLTEAFQAQDRVTLSATLSADW